jgi:uncharacterized damage-inducible protein DinB
VAAVVAASKATGPTADKLLEQLLLAWRLNNKTNLILLRVIPRKGFAAVPLASRGMTVAAQFAHLHKVRRNWMRFNGENVRGIPVFRKGAQPDRARLVRAFRISGKAVENYVATRLRQGTKVKYFKGQPLRWLIYMIAHESHHRGSILLALKQNGMRMPQKVAVNGVWLTWYWGKA